MIGTVISRIFDPFVMLAVLFWLVFSGTPHALEAFSLMVGLPFLLFLFAWKMRVIKTWDVRDRRERPKILWILLGIETVASVILGTSLAIPVLIAILGFTLITQYWKISGHTMTATLTTGYIVMKFGFEWWPILFVVPLVAWARIVTKNHTLLQVLAGALYACTIVVLWYEIR